MRARKREREMKATQIEGETESGRDREGGWVGGRVGGVECQTTDTANHTAHCKEGAGGDGGCGMVSGFFCNVTPRVTRTHTHIRTANTPTHRSQVRLPRRGLQL